MANSLNSFFRDFQRSFVGTNILNSFNNLIDGIEWSKDISIDEVKKFAEDVHCELIVRIFNEKLTAFDSKNIAIENTSTYEIVDREMFMKIYDSLSPSMKKFAEFLFASPKLIYKHYVEKIKDEIIDSHFSFYLNENMKNIDVECIYGPYSIIDCIVNPSVSSSILTEINNEEISNGDLFWSHVDLVLSYGKTTGNSITTFNKAYEILQRISPIWNQLKVSSQTMSDDEVEINVPVTDGNEANDVDTVIKAFQGNYSVIPSTYPMAKGVCFGLVSNFINFNKLDKDRKLQVSNYLLNNRPKFNEILQVSCKIVSDSIARDCEKMSEIDFTKYSVQDISKIGYNDENDEITKNVAMRIRKSFAQVRDGNVMQKMNYISSCFIPLMNKFRSEIMNKYSTNSSRIFEKINNDMQIFGGSIYEEKGDVEVIPEKETVVVEKVEPVHLFSIAASDFDDIFSMNGGDYIDIRRNEEYSPEQMIRDIEQAQRNFNKSYVEIYRELIKAIENVKIGNVYKQTMNKLYPLCRVFDDIAIKKPETTIYLSGLYGKDNRNSAYRQVVDETIKTLKDSGVQSFGDAIRVLEKLSKLLIDSAAKAREIKNKFINSPKTSSILLIKAGEAVTIPCELTQRDFNNFDEAIRRLFWQIRNSRSESSILSNKDELKKYIEKAKNREELIRSQFMINVQEINYFANQISDTGLRNSWIENKKILNDELLKSTLYINNVVETYFTEQKMKNLDSHILTKAEIENIEHSFTLFKSSKMSQGFKEEFKTLNRMLRENKNIFEITNQFAKIISASRYIEFISMIYKTFHIFDDKFKWDEFQRNITKFIIFNSIEIGCLVDLPDIFATKPNQRRVQTIDNWVQDYTWKLVSMFDKRENYNDVLVTLQSVVSCFEFFNKSDIKFINSFNVDKELQRKFIASIARIDIGDDGAITSKPLNTADGEYTDMYAELFGKTVPVTTIVEKLGLTDPAQIASATKNIEEFIKIIKNESDMYKDYKITRKFVRGTGVDIINFNKQEEDTRIKNRNLIISSVFDSLILNVVAIVDKYWAMRYHGKFNLPMNIEMMIKGGNVFDSVEFHDISHAKVIPEATPFYITALNICEYYINKLGNRDADSGKIINKLEISSISNLYPIYTIFKEYKATVATLTTSQLTTAIGILNDFWNQTRGENSVKLSTAIDILLNELNASIFLGSGNETYIDGVDVQSNSFARLAMSNIEELLKIIESIYKSAVINCYEESPEEQQIIFEDMMRKAYHRIRDCSESQRMSELKFILNSKDDSDYSLDEYYKFMDLVISPLTICYKSYTKIFHLFDVYATIFNPDGVSQSIDLRNEVIKIDGNDVNVWTYINGNPDSNILMNSDVVNTYNTIQYMKIFENYIDHNRIIAPDFWYPTIKSSYPSSPIANYSINSTKVYSIYNLQLMNIFGNIGARSMADYFEFAVKEFVSDLDQVLHVFMSYPGMRNKAIENIQKELHDNITYDKLMSNPTIQSRMEMFRDVKIEKDMSYIYPKYSSIPSLPIFVDGNLIYPSIDLSTEKSHFSLDGTDIHYVVYPDDKLPEGIPIRIEGGKWRNGWVDFVILSIARCHPFRLIPYKLVQLLQTDFNIGRFCKPMLVGNDRKNSYSYSVNYYDGNEKIFNNIFTQNIIARSSCDSNKEITDYSAFGQNVVNNIVSIIPYLISTITSVRDSTSPSVTYTGVKVVDECSSIISILTNFYDGISRSITPISFLQKSMTETSHPIGEIMSYIDRSLDEIDSYSVMEWANVYKFSNLTSIVYPDFKNHDKFAYIHKFAENKFSHPVFRANFSIIIENIAKQFWNSVIVNDSLVSTRDTLPSVNPEFIDMINRILSHWIETGRYKKDELQFMFDTLAGSFKNEFGVEDIRITGGAVDPEFAAEVKKFSEKRHTSIIDNEVSIDNLMKSISSGIYVKNIADSNKYFHNANEERISVDASASSAAPLLYLINNIATGKIVNNSVSIVAKSVEYKLEEKFKKTIDNYNNAFKNIYDSNEEPIFDLTFIQYLYHNRRDVYGGLIKFTDDRNKNIVYDRLNNIAKQQIEMQLLNTGYTVRFCRDVVRYANRNRQNLVNVNNHKYLAYFLEPKNINVSTMTIDTWKSILAEGVYKNSIYRNIINDSVIDIFDKFLNENISANNYDIFDYVEEFAKYSGIASMERGIIVDYIVNTLLTKKVPGTEKLVVEEIYNNVNRPGKYHMDIFMKDAGIAVNNLDPVDVEVIESVNYDNYIVNKAVDELRNLSVNAAQVNELMEKTVEIIPLAFNGFKKNKYFGMIYDTIIDLHIHTYSFNQNVYMMYIQYIAGTTKVISYRILPFLYFNDDRYGVYDVDANNPTYDNSGYVIGREGATNLDTSITAQGTTIRELEIIKIWSSMYRSKNMIDYNKSIDHDPDFDEIVPKIIKGSVSPKLVEDFIATKDKHFKISILILLLLNVHDKKKIDLVLREVHWEDKEITKFIHKYMNVDFTNILGENNIHKWMIIRELYRMYKFADGYLGIIDKQIEAIRLGNIEIGDCPDAYIKNTDSFKPDYDRYASYEMKKYNFFITLVSFANFYLSNINDDNNKDIHNFYNGNIYRKNPDIPFNPVKFGKSTYGIEGFEFVSKALTHIKNNYQRIHSNIAIHKALRYYEAFIRLHADIFKINVDNLFYTPTIMERVPALVLTPITNNKYWSFGDVVVDEVFNNEVNKSVNSISQIQSAFKLSILDMLSGIIDRNVNSFINVNGDEISNFGFLITGGYDMDELVRSYGEGISPKQIMESLYKNQVIPWNIYTNLFNASYKYKNCDSNQIFALAMNYFHKFDISIAPIFNNLCYAQLLTNHIHLVDIVKKLNTTVIDNISDELVKDGKYNKLSPAYKYISNAISFMQGLTAYDEKESEDVLGWNTKRIRDDLYIPELNKIYVDPKTGRYEYPTTEPSLVLGVNPSFIWSFLAYTINHVKTNHTATTKEIEDNVHPYNGIHKLLFSNAFENIERLNYLTEYLNSLMIVLRRTSYTNEFNEDVSYFTGSDVTFDDPMKF